MTVRTFNSKVYFPCCLEFGYRTFDSQSFSDARPESCESWKQQLISIIGGSGIRVYPFDRPRYKYKSHDC